MLSPTATAIATGVTITVQPFSEEKKRADLCHSLYLHDSVDQMINRAVLADTSGCTPDPLPRQSGVYSTPQCLCFFRMIALCAMSLIALILMNPSESC
jgi:hypothetical protein